MAWIAKINFRSTTAGPGAGVSEGVREIKLISLTDTSAGVGEIYDVARSNGIDIIHTGWTSASVDTRDRSDVPGVHFAGLHMNGLNTNTLQLDLPNTGQFDIRIASGDYSNAQATNKWEIYDDTTLLISSTSGTSAPQKFIAQDGQEYDYSVWDAVPAVRKTFATTTFNLILGNGAAANTGYVSYLEVAAVVSGGVTRPMWPMSW